MKYRRIAPCVLAALLAACSTTSVKEEPPAPLPEFAAEAEVKTLWTENVGSLTGTYEAHLAPVLDKGTLYVTNVDGKVYALAADTGKAKWTTDLKVTVTGATGVGDGLVVIGTRSGAVIALSADTGERRWSAAVSSEVDSAPAVAQGVVVVQSIDGRVTGLDVEGGKTLWTSDRSEPALSLRGTSRTVVVANFVVTGFASGKLVALQLNDGKTLWEHEIAQPRGRNDVERLVDVDATPILWGETIFAVAYQGKLTALEARSGREVWVRDVSSYVGLDVDSAAVYVADSDGNVVSFSREAGASMWKQDKLQRRRLGTPTLHGDAVVVGDFEGHLHWLARDDGRFIAHYRLDSAEARVGGIVDGDTLYAASQGGRLAALQLTKK